MSSIRVITSADELRAPCDVRVALVPTMGALHEGHLSLVRRAAELADRVVVSIFVNPTQFGPNEDFSRYPRDLDADVAALDKLSVSLDAELVVFAPSVELMYPDFPQPPRITIDPGKFGSGFEGVSRPGHFAGVCQVVAKLFNLVQPQVAVFGQKDAQQLAVIRQMVRDLSYSVQIVGAPIVRDDDGLALSSRNSYLSADERQQALALSQSLQLGLQRARNDHPGSVVESVWEFLQQAEGVEPEYVALVNAEDFAPLYLCTPTSVRGYRRESTSNDGILLLAARVGSTRLIDNCEVELKHGDER